jgi:flagellar biosynthesis/type III secretory pathway chaperone
MFAAGEQNTPALGLDTLAREAEALTRVLHALEAEHDALITSDAEGLESAIADKNDALEGYMSAKSAREAEGVSHNLQTVTNHPRLSAGQQATGVELASTIRAAGESCKTLNHRNGMLISALRDRTQQAINIVRGNDSGVTLYGQQGNAHLDGGSRVLGTA